MKPEEILNRVQEKLGTSVLEARVVLGDAVAVVQKSAIRPLARFLKEDSDLNFNVLMDLTAVDYLKMQKFPRFEVVYHFYSLKQNHRLRVKVPVEEEDLVMESLTPLWPIANWFEREVWDMFGIRFADHPNLKRIMMYEEFVGHPLRKDYPVRKRQPLMGPVN